MSERIGFLGLGIMGSRMAANVAKAGYPLTVWTHTEGKAERWASEHRTSEHRASEHRASEHRTSEHRTSEHRTSEHRTSEHRTSEHGPVAVGTPAEVAAASDIVVSMVVDGAQVESVLCGAGGVVEGAAEGLLCVDMSTIAPIDTRRIAGRLAERGIGMVDAPVTGSSPRAEAGTLTIMVGGEQSDYARARPLLEAMGELIVYVGELGQGEMLKLINNSLGAANAAAVAEALLLAAATGVDLDALVAVTQSGSGASAQMAMKSGAMREHDYATLFKTEHLLKDVRLCLEEAQAAGIPFPAAAHARDLLAATMGRGHGADDYAALIEAAEGLAGRRL